LTALLRNRYPEADILATDLSEAMLEVASRVLALEPRITYEKADVEALADHLAQPYPDLITGSAVLQWLENPRLTVSKLARKVAPGGGVAFATFGPASLAELQRALEPFGIEHPVARLPRSEDWQESLSEFNCEVYRDEVKQWAHDARSFLKELSLMGAALPHAGMSPGNLRRMLDRYDTFADHRGLPVTWERIFIVVRAA
jgi:malonyl-CoA O-methyltransferase